MPKYPRITITDKDYVQMKAYKQEMLDKFIKLHRELGMPENLTMKFDPVEANIYLNLLSLKEKDEFKVGLHAFVAQSEAHKEYDSDKFFIWVNDMLTDAERKELKEFRGNLADLAHWPNVPYGTLIKKNETIN